MRSNKDRERAHCEDFGQGKEDHPTVLSAVIRKINNSEITNSKDIRKLRQILKDPVAREEFMGDGGSIDTAIQKLAPAPTKRGQGLLGDIEALTETLRRYPWTTLTSLKGDAQVVRKLDEAEKLLKELRKTLSR